jgi:porphobilinogen deaminase
MGGTGSGFAFDMLAEKRRISLHRLFLQYFIGNCICPVGVLAAGDDMVTQEFVKCKA